MPKELTLEAGRSFFGNLANVARKPLGTLAVTAMAALTPSLVGPNLATAADAYRGETSGASQSVHSDSSPSYLKRLEELEEGVLIGGVLALVIVGGVEAMYRREDRRA